MNFRDHSKLKGTHAFLSASQYHWINYSEDKLIERYVNDLAKEQGTILHDFAAQCISLRQRLQELPKTLNLYVNDAIGFNMIPEQILYYSEFIYGTADAICFRNNKLRIHDLKTGQTPAHIEQLLIYAALFCLEYKYKPSDIEIELRLYQFDDYITYIPTVEEIVPIMDKIITFDKILNKTRREEIGE